MSTVAEKLSYLADTKDLFKDRLNSLGAEITSSTTFRNYLNWLDTFYGEVSDKTDLSENGVVGRTSQESTTGKNLLNTNNIVTGTTNGITTSYNAETQEITLDGTCTTDNTQVRISTDAIDFTSGVTKMIAYYVSGSVDVSQTIDNRLLFRSFRGGGQWDLYADVNIATLNSSNPIVSITGGSTGTKSLIDLRVDKNSVLTNFKIKLMVTDSSDTEWEKFTFGASPNPDYPQPINNLSGDVAYKVSGKNLLDIKSYLKQSDRGIIPTYNQDGSVTLSGTATTNFSNFTRNISDVLEKNKTYTLSVIGTKNFAIGCRVFYNDDTNEDFNITSSNTYVNVIPTKDVNSFRIYMYSLTSETNYNTTLYFQLEENSTATDFEPYIESQTFNIPLKSKNLFDKNNFEVFDGYYIGGGGNFRTASNNHTARIIIEPNTTYTISKPLTTNNRLRVGISSHEMTTKESFNIWGGSDTATDVTLTSASDSKYMYIYYAIENEKQLALDALQVEKGSTATTYEPYYDIELCKIVDYKDFIKKGTGKNLCGIPNQSFNFNGVDITIEDGTITLNGTATTTGTTYLQPIKTTTLKGTYTNNIIYISGTDPGSSFGNFNIRKESDSSVIQGSQAVLYSNNSNSTTTIEEDTNIIFGIYIRKNNVYTNYKFRPQLVKTATADYNYEPYGMYNKWYIEKNIGKVVLDGSEGWQEQSSSTANHPRFKIYTLSYDYNMLLPSSNNDTFYGLCNNFKPLSTSNTYNSNQGISLDITSNLAFYVNDITTVANFKTWLSTHNTIVYYVLNTPTTTEITQENYPSLYNALKQIQDYLTAYKINKEFILGYSSPEIEY